MLSSSDIEKKIDGIRAIDDIVGAMKAYAGAAIRKTEDVVQNVRMYEENVLSAMARISAGYPGAAPELPAEGKRIVVVFGSSQGLCGSYNENIADKVSSLTGPDDIFFITGKRLRGAFEKRAISYAAFIDSVSSVSGIEAAVRATAAQLNRLYAGKGYYTLTFIFMMIAEKQPLITMERILPPDVDRVSAPPRRFPPLTYLDPRRVFNGALEEFLAISLYRCYLESLRSENWFRLRSMESASESLKKRLSDLRALGKFARQEEITEELLEILGSGAFFR